MKTVILKWNPAFSSYSMSSYLHDLFNMRTKSIVNYNWSVWDHQQIHKGDRFFWVKVGMYGQTGILSSGTIISEPYKAEDWSGKGRETYYINFLPDVLLNPDALPILTCQSLTQTIPDFEWTKGHSGLVLTDNQASRLEKLWTDFLNNNNLLFTQTLSKHYPEDLIYMNQVNRSKTISTDSDGFNGYDPLVEP